MEPARRAYLIASNRRWRAVFAALALVLPLVLGALFRRQERRLRALADHGVFANATITRNDGHTTHYTWSVDGRAYDWNVRADDLPARPGMRLAIVYLPEDPALGRPAPFTRAAVDAQYPRRTTLGFPLGLFVFFALASAACHRGLVRLASGDDPAPRAPPSPELMGRAVGALLLACVLGVNLYADVDAVSVRLWGARPWGLPVGAVVGVVECALFTPFWWVLPELMRIAQSALARGGSVSKVGLALAVVQAGPELRRARNVVLAGAAYFAALMAAWIAYTAHRGV